MPSTLIQVLGQIQPGSIILDEPIPTLSIGRTILATVLSTPKDGRVLVSMFGRRLLVDTTLALTKGQVLTFKVHALSPRIVLKPHDIQAGNQGQGIRDLGAVVGRLVGGFGEKPLEAFRLQEVLEHLSQAPERDAQAARVLSQLVEQALQYPQASTFLFVPLLDGDAQGSARVWAERDGEGYLLRFAVETNRLGSLECIARLDQGVDVEIRASSQETVDFLAACIGELREGLEPLGVRYIRISHATIKDQPVRGVDVLV